VKGFLARWQAESKREADLNDKVEAELVELAEGYHASLLAAAESGEMWRAIEAALLLGRAQGRYEAQQLAYAKGLATTTLNAIDLYPHVARRDTERRGAAKAGRKRKGRRKAGHVTDAQLRAAVDTLMKKGETPTNARRKVSERFEIPMSTLRDRTKKK
jgi:hypothetical protein